MTLSCDTDGPDDPVHGSLQLTSTKVGTQYLTLQGPNTGIQVDESILIAFSNSLDTATVRNSILLTAYGNNAILFDIAYLDNYKTISISPEQEPQLPHRLFTLQITDC